MTNTAFRSTIPIHLHKWETHPKGWTNVERHTIMWPIHQNVFCFSFQPDETAEFQPCSQSDYVYKRWWFSLSTCSVCECVFSCFCDCTAHCSCCKHYLSLSVKWGKFTAQGAEVFIQQMRWSRDVRVFRRPWRHSIISLHTIYPNWSIIIVPQLNYDSEKRHLEP